MSTIKWYCWKCEKDVAAEPVAYAVVREDWWNRAVEVTVEVHCPECNDPGLSETVTVILGGITYVKR